MYSSFVEMLNRWKKLKRSGGFRRKVNKYYDILSTNGQVNTTSSLSSNNNNGVLINKPPEELVNDNLLDEKPIDADEEIDEERITNNWLDDVDSNEEIIENTLELEKNAEFRKNMRLWAVSFNVSHLALKGLFQNINHRFPNLLPQDPRTLLKTSQTVLLTNVGTGSYWHHGFESSLRQIFANIREIPKKISCNINMDGLPVYKSSRYEFWPILFNIHEFPKLKPMIIGIYCGKGKPSDLTGYLQPFVEEAKVLLADALLINNTKISLTLRCFICDSPARAFIKGVANFNSKQGCLKCTTVGEYSYVSRTVYFPRSGCEKRTDAGFRAKIYGSHHKQDSPLTLLPVDMIEDFPVGDSLHLIDLGIMKRCLLGWRDGSFGNYKTKWCVKDIIKVTKFLENCRLPSEIHRSVRGLDVLGHWKGTEYRTFLYYLGIIILKDVLPSDVYRHYLKFFCAVTICSSHAYSKFLDLAKNLFDSYLEYFCDIYGEDYISSNVHNLTHLVDEVKKFGPVTNFNSYPFESRLFQIKNLLRSGNLPLAQVAKRISEIVQSENIILTDTLKNDSKFPILKNKTADNLFKKIEFDNFILVADKCKKWFLTENNQVVNIRHVLLKDGVPYISGSTIKYLSNVFETPIRSAFLNIFKSKSSDLGSHFYLYPVSCIKCKLVAVEYENETFFLPLLHTLN